MKKSKKKSLLLTMLCSGLMLTACNSEEEMISGGGNETDGKVMYATVAYNGTNDPKTRMGYTDDLATNYLKLTWSEGDKFSAFANGSTTKNDFTIEALEKGNYTANETFKCNNFSAQNITDGTIIDAIYPSVANETVNPQNIMLSLTSQTQNNSSSTAHLSNYDYMVGHAIYRTSSPDKLDFNFKDAGDGNAGRLASIYRVKLVFPSSVTNVSKIVISCTDNTGNASLVTSEKVNFTNWSTSAIAAAKGDVTLNVTNGATENIDGVNTFVAYVMLFPSAVKTRTITVTTNEEKPFTATKNYDNEIIYTRGQFKYINADFRPVNLKSAYTGADYFMWDAKENIINLATGEYNFKTTPGNAENSCKDAPSYEELKKYLGAGVYWDPGTTGENQQTFKAPVSNNNLQDLQSQTYHTGLWMIRKQYIPADTKGMESINPKNNPSLFRTGRPSPEVIHKYFFLPATGLNIFGNFRSIGSHGFYWTSTSSDNDTKAYRFYFLKDTAALYGDSRHNGYRLMIRE